MTEDFYDKVAKKFGGYRYGTEPQFKSEYPAGNPEMIFKEKLDLLNIDPAQKIKQNICKICSGKTKKNCS